jgi:hypothetical protein
VVYVAQLELRPMFPSRDVVQLHASKEANLCGIYVNII